jgi:hypothetical protein
LVSPDPRLPDGRGYASGRDEDARRVAIASQHRRRKDRHLPGRLSGLLLDALAGYGYRTWLGWIVRHAPATSGMWSPIIGKIKEAVRRVQF